MRIPQSKTYYLLLTTLHPFFLCRICYYSSTETSKSRWPSLFGLECQTINVQFETLFYQHQPPLPCPMPTTQKPTGLISPQQPMLILIAAWGEVGGAGVPLTPQPLMIIIFHNLLLMFFPSQCNDAYYNSWLEQINFQCSFQVNVMNNDGGPYNCLGSS